MQSKLISLIKKNKKIPIIGKGNYKQIINKSHNLINNKYKIIEITLRSKYALKAAIDIKKNFPELLIGIGSVTSASQLLEVYKYNFDFYISPGINSKILKIANKYKIKYIPAVSTPSEVMLGLEYKFNLMKFFPSEFNGGIKKLNTFADIFEDAIFIPTGGINNSNFKSYLKLSNVIGVGSTDFK